MPTTSTPVASGSSVPPWPTLIFFFTLGTPVSACHRRTSAPSVPFIFDTTSWLVHPAGFRIATSPFGIGGGSGVAAAAAASAPPAVDDAHRAGRRGALRACCGRRNAAARCAPRVVGPRASAPAAPRVHRQAASMRDADAMGLRGVSEGVAGGIPERVVSWTVDFPEPDDVAPWLHAQTTRRLLTGDWTVGGDAVSGIGVACCFGFY